MAPRVDKLLASVPSIEPFKSSGGKEGGGVDNFGGDLKKWIKLGWNKPKEFAEKLIKEQ